MKKRAFRRKNKAKIKVILFYFLTGALILAILLTMADTRVRSQLNTIAASQAKNISTIVINAAVMEVLAQNTIQYDDLVTLEYDLAGRVSAIKADSINMNKLQALIISKISQRIGELKFQEIDLALGSLTGIDVLNNKGPRYKVRIRLTGNAGTSIENKFESAGINQTRHQIILSIKTNVFVVLPSGSTSTQVLSDLTIAETIIIGLVPEFYADSNRLFGGEEK